MGRLAISGEVSRDQTSIVSRYQELAKVVLLYQHIVANLLTWSGRLREALDEADLVLSSMPDGAVTRLKYWGPRDK
jgi:hypothetical protein